ncbi:hypothetical protein HBDW_35050 [Herbaspirillum sp. DW155]|uniref:hypothetical protein n=1 Tax=Herbaspirillum sp. DW155 TaxID=3095609 RepID=UPI00308DAB4C|nr:hypothetical protein HBDW_35050 [Herbaspirillum sp. DW155]
MSDVMMKLHIEKPGTTYFHREGGADASLVGHVWIEIAYPDGKTSQGGFAPANSKEGIYSVQGEVQRSDKDAYAGESEFTATYKITEMQAQTLERYFLSPAPFGFDKSNYHALTNSCVDFVWKGLQQIGMNPSGFEGHTLPMANRDDFSTLRNPHIPGGGLVHVESRDVQPVMEDPMVSPFNDWWWAAPAPWISVSPVPAEDAYLPRGTITVGPLSPPVPVQQDGTNYADGTGYQ